MQDGINKLFRFVAPALISAAFLTACGGSDTAVAPSTLSGTAAVGLPIVSGTIDVKCAGGSPLTTTTSTTGTWQVTISGQTLPCAVQVSGGKLGTAMGAPQSQPFHSIAVSLGTVNVTPLTDLIVANLTGANPGTWFDAAIPSFTDVDAGTIAAARKTVSDALGLGTPLGNINPLNDSFQAQNGDRIDDILEAMQAALTSQAFDYAALLAASSNGNILTLTGDGSAFSGAYDGLTGGTNNGGGSVNCGANETALVYSDYPNTTGSYTDGQQVCFEASTTELKFSGKTLTTPVSTGVAYKFTDTDTSLTYEVVLINGALDEINVLNGTTFEGQFAPVGTNAGATDPNSGGGSTNTPGSPTNLGTLTVTGTGATQFGSGFTPGVFESSSYLGLSWQYVWKNDSQKIQLYGATVNVTALSGSQPLWQEPLSSNLVFDAVAGSITFNDVTTKNTFNLAQGPMVLNGTLYLTPMNTGPISLSGTGINFTGSGFNAPTAVISSTSAADVWTWTDPRGSSMKLTYLKTNGKYQLSFTGLGDVPFLSAISTLATLGIVMDTAAKTVTFTSTNLGNNNTGKSVALSGSATLP